MTIQPANRLNSISDYVHLAWGQRIKEVEATTGNKVLNVSPGIPYFRPSQHYLDALQRFVQEPDAHLYPPYGPLPEFSAALQHWYQSRFHVALPTENLYPVLGSKDAIAHIALALINPGDEVLVPDPGYPAFTSSTLIAGGIPIPYALGEDAHPPLDIATLEKQINPRTKYIWVNFPSNPTGHVAHLSLLQQLVDMAHAHKILILYDNAYSEITFDGYVAPSILEIPGAFEVALELGSCSKMFSFAGFRIGWVAGNNSIIAALKTMKSHMDSGLSRPLQQLAAYAFIHPDHAWRQNMLARYQANRDILVQHFRGMGLTGTPPAGGLFVWARIPATYRNADEYSKWLLQEKQVAVTPGTAFGNNGTQYIRANIATPLEHINKYLPV